MFRNMVPVVYPFFQDIKLSTCALLVLPDLSQSHSARAEPLFVLRQRNWITRWEIHRVRINH